MTSATAITNPKEVLDRALAFAIAQHQQGNLKQAEQTYRQILQAVPNQADALFHLAMLLVQTGQREEAAKYYRTLLKGTPNHADAWNNLGNILQSLSQNQEAAEAFDRARAIRPSQPEFHYNYGNLMMSLQGYDQAEEAYRTAVVLKPDYLQAWNNLGLALQEQGKLKEAVDIFCDILAKDAALPQTWNNLGVVHGLQGNHGEAEQAFRKALQHDPRMAAAWRQLTESRRFQSSEEEDARTMRILLDTPNLSEADAMHLHYALGKIHDDCSEYEQAFSHFQRANTLQKHSVSFDSPQHQEYVRRIAETFTSEFFSACEGWGNAEAQPLFIVGLPRTGKTLIERILTKHSAVYAGGEKILIRRVVEAISLKGGKNCYPEATLSLQSDVVKVFADAYIEQQWQKGQISAQYVTDTLPYNFLHLGLIALLFPKARILHCVRHPLDTILLNYFHYFVRGSGHACDLEHLAAYYENYRILMSHWKHALPLPVYEISYETLVSYPEKEAMRILDFLSLESCPAYLEESRTLHTGEVGKWRNYAQYLASVKQRLSIAE